MQLGNEPHLVVLLIYFLVAHLCQHVIKKLAPLAFFFMNEVIILFDMFRFFVEYMVSGYVNGCLIVTLDCN